MEDTPVQWAGYEIKLEKLKLGLTQALTPEVLEDTRVDVFLDHFIDQILITVRGHIWSKQLEHIEIEYPANWRQAVKERWFPNWALKKWPVIKTRHVCDVKITYPELHKKYAINNQSSFVRIIQGHFSPATPLDMSDGVLE